MRLQVKKDYEIAVKTTIHFITDADGSSYSDRFPLIAGVSSGRLQGIDEYEASEEWNKGWLTIRKALDQCSDSQKHREEPWYYGVFKIHPCQFVIKKYMPPDGLLAKSSFLTEFHTIATSLQALENAGELAMPWLNFYLWRVGVVSAIYMEKRDGFVSAKREFVRGMLIDICTREGKKYSDPILRTAYLRGKELKLKRKAPATRDADGEDEFFPNNKARRL